MKSLKLLVSFTFALVLASYVHRVESQIRAPRVTADQRRQESAQQQKNEYRKYVEQKLSAFGERLRELRAQAEKTGEKARLKFEQASREFNRKMAVAKQSFARIKAEAAQAWEEAKDKIAVMMKDLERSYERLAERWNKPADKS